MTNTLKTRHEGAVHKTDAKHKCFICSKAEGPHGESCIRSGHPKNRFFHVDCLLRRVDHLEKSVDHLEKRTYFHEAPSHTVKTLQSPANGLQPSHTVNTYGDPAAIPSTRCEDCNHLHIHSPDCPRRRALGTNVYTCRECGWVLGHAPGCSLGAL